MAQKRKKVVAKKAVPVKKSGKVKAKPAPSPGKKAAKKNVQTGRLVKKAAKNKIPIDDKSSKENHKRDVSAKGAVGNRSVTINVKMDNLVKEFKIITTNIKESPEKILELLKPAFLSVTNDSQIIGNR